MMKRIWIGVLLWSAPVLAPRIEVDYLRDGQTITVEVFYPGDGSPARGASVEVQDRSGRVVAAGKTDDDGAFTFLQEGEGPLTVIAEDGAHRATCEVASEDGAPQEPGGDAPRRVAGTTIRREPLPVVQIVAGLGLIFGLGGLLLAYCAWRRSLLLQKRLEKLEGSDTDAP